MYVCVCIHYCIVVLLHVHHSPVVGFLCYHTHIHVHVGFAIVIMLAKLKAANIRGQCQQYRAKLTHMPAIQGKANTHASNTGQS